MAVTKAHTNGVDLAYETFGGPADPPMLLVMGLNTQMIGWPEPFCRDLANRGFYVIRFDNRDIGLSTHLDGVPTPSIYKVALRLAKPPYTIEDMAADTVGLLDALGLDRVHLVGASMGGFISQTVALNHPERIASLTLIMTSTGSWRVGQATRQILGMVLRGKPPSSREEAIDGTVAMFEFIGGEGFEFDEALVRQYAEMSYDRGYDPAGTARQFLAVVSQRNRTNDLKKLTAPTLVIHGLHDPMVGASGGIALARAIPGARFVGFHGMGHGLPQQLWPQLVDEIVAITKVAG